MRRCFLLSGFCILLAAVSILAFASSALAHKLNVFAYAEAGKVFVEVYFADGKPVENGKVAVFSNNGQKIFEGTTGKDGKSSFPIPAKDDLKIEVDASLGHKNTFTLRKEEL